MMLEWLVALQSTSGYDCFTAAFEKVKTFPVFQVKAETANMAIAAAETVAIYLSRCGDDVPIEVVEFLKDHPICPTAVTHEARRVVERVLRQSELVWYWRDNIGWKSCMRQLQARLKES